MHIHTLYLFLPREKHASECQNNQKWATPAAVASYILGEALRESVSLYCAKKNDVSKGRVCVRRNLL